MILLPHVPAKRWRWRGQQALLLLLLSLAGLPALSAHAELEEQIEQATAAIAKDPTNARLRLGRAELYRLHEQFDEAFADLEVAAGLDTTLEEIEFVRAKLYVDLKYRSAARTAFDHYLARVPAAVEAYLARARLFADLQEIPLAIADYSQAIAHSKQPLPEYFIERARLELLKGGGGPAAAVKGLDEGIAKIGPIVTLELPAKDLDLAAGRYDAALARIDLLMQASDRKETHLEIRGAILEQAGRKEAALTAYREALTSLAKAPEGAQVTSASQALKTRLQQRIESLINPPPAIATPAAPTPRTLPQAPASSGTPAPTNP
ncbi:MAG TPA: tetratricopeptide repeat protein [Planctomycetota bacterium]|nr:tetratricopeptide repeat protein [Planctomycetota bacterium]